MANYASLFCQSRAERGCVINESATPKSENIDVAPLGTMLRRERYAGFRWLRGGDRRAQHISNTSSKNYRRKQSTIDYVQVKVHVGYTRLERFSKHLYNRLRQQYLAGSLAKKVIGGCLYLRSTIYDEILVVSEASECTDERWCFFSVHVGKGRSTRSKVNFCRGPEVQGES